MFTKNIREVAHWAKKLIGQREILLPLISAAANDKFPHAVLIEGNPGFGGLALALAVAENILCENPGMEGSCGQCYSCTKTEILEHPDLHFAFPVVKKSDKSRADTVSDDFMMEWRKMTSESCYFSLNQWVQNIADSSARADINTRECNNIISKLTLQAFKGKNKVYIIWMADYLGKEGNRLLKTIEEPPPNSHLILVCESVDQILKTIYSRCQLIKLPSINEEDIASHMENKFALTPSESRQISFLSEGSIVEAQAYMSAYQTNSLNEWLNFFELLSRPNYAELKNWVDKLGGFDSDSQKQFLGYGLKILRESIHLRLRGRKHTKLIDEEMNKLESDALLIGLGLDELVYLSDKISESMDLIDRNINIKIMMFNFALDFERILRSKSLNGELTINK